MAAPDHPSIRQVWWMFVVAGFRSIFGVLVFILMVATTIYLFGQHRISGGFLMIGLTIFIFGRIPAAIGAYLGARDRQQ